MPFEFKPQHDYDLHIALEVERAGARADAGEGQGARASRRAAISDHGFIDSIYFRDPNGYVIELTAKRANHDEEMDPADERRAREARPLAGGEAGDGGHDGLTSGPAAGRPVAGEGA